MGLVNNKVMKESLKTSFKAVVMLLCLAFAIVASAGAFSTKEGIYIVAGIGNLIFAIYVIYTNIIKHN